jgi:hypothetical protein
MNALERCTREFLQNPINSYRRLADHLNHAHPRADGFLWTKDSAYHFCRTHGISSRRRCRSQPAASITQRTRTRRAILDSLASAIGAAGISLASLAPFQVNDIARLSGYPLATISSNWDRLEEELLSAAKLPRKPIVLHIVEDEA